MEKIKEKVKNYFQIEDGYHFEWNDLRALITVVNVILIMIFGLDIAWFGLAVAILGLVKDILVDRRINGMIMHIANIGLNIFFLCML